MRDYDILLQSDKPFKVKIYKKNGNKKFKTIGKKIHYKIDKYDKPSYIKVRNEKYPYLHWIEKYIKDIKVLTFIYVGLSVLTMYYFVFISVKDIYLRIFLFILLSILVIMEDLTYISDRFTKTILKVK